jgi:plasmid maintenance system antidote protein VapI
MNKQDLHDADVSPAIGHILEFLKGEIKRQNMTYRDVAEHLDKSEATVKRMLNSAQLGLDQLDALGKILGYDLPRLLAVATNPDLSTGRMTAEQESALAARPAAFTYFYRLWDGDTPADIERSTGISHASTRSYLRFLEEQKLIEVMPGDKVKTFFRGWRLLFIPNGPLNALMYPKRFGNVVRRMQERGQPDVFAHATSQGWLGRYGAFHLDPPRYAEFLTDMEALLRRYDQLSANTKGTQGREPVTVAAFIDRFDLYEGVHPEIVEF